MRADSYNGHMIESAGFIIVDFSGETPRALCLLNDYGHWDFPKGHLEQGESRFDAALRETEEECGLTTSDFRFSQKFASTLPYSVAGGKKVSTFYFAERVSDTAPVLHVNPALGKPEHVLWRWMPVSSLRDKMSKRLWPVLDKLELWCERPLSNDQN